MIDTIKTLLVCDNDSALARYLHVAPSTISRWRLDPRKIPIEKVALLAKRRGYRVTLSPMKRKEEYY